MTSENEGTQSELIIWQQNLNKSQVGQHDIISSGKLVSENIDIIAIQEPAINFKDKTIAARDWIPIYPSTHEKEPRKTRSIILMSRRLPTENWEQMEYMSGDVTVVKINGNWGQITLFNIYNDCAHNETIHELMTFCRTNRATLAGSQERESTHHMIWVGDFNRHHPAWDKPEDTRLFTREALEAAELLIKATADLRLDSALPAGVPTHIHNVTKRWTRLDQVYVSENLMDAIISCKAQKSERGLNTDHLPIVTKLDISLTRTQESTTRNFRNVDWEKFQEELQRKMAPFGLPARIRDQVGLNRECERLTTALQETIKKIVPNTEVCPKSKRWWTKEIKEIRRRFRKLGRALCKHTDQPEHAIHKEYKECRKQYERAIRYNKRHHWRDWLERASEPDLWTANKYIAAPASDGGSTRIPKLKQQLNGQERTANSNQDKSELLANTFFPKKPANEEENRAQQEYPPPICEANKISQDQIRRQLKRLKPFKAPGPDGIPNIVLTRCADLIVDRLWYIFNAILEKEIYYAPWKHFTTVVLRKPGKPRYDTPKAYRPIALLNTLGKLMTAAVAEQLAYYTERYALLPHTHFGGRPGRTTTDALHSLVYRIKDAWRKHQVVSVLFLDIEGAFPNAVNERLEHNLKTRKVPNKIVKFINNLLKERYTALKFDDYLSDKIALNNGIGQGDPLSMILYQYYNADLLDIPKGDKEAASAYVDDAILVATAKDFEKTHEVLADMMTREGGAVDWSNKHNSRFELSKLALIDFAHRNSKKPRPNLTLPNVTLEPSHNTKYLGVYIDQHLAWNIHVAYTLKKGAKWSSQIRRVVAPSWGLTPKHARKMYCSVAIPRILYAADVWGVPKPIEGLATHKGTSTAIAKLTSTQRAGALAVTGGLRTTPTDVLDIHAHLLPIHLEIDKICHRAATRIATLPPDHPLHKPARKCSTRKVKRHKSPLHLLMQAYNVRPQEVESIRPAMRNPALTHKRPFTVSIANSKDNSITEDTQAKEKVKIYTDGSAQDGKVGAAALLLREGQPDRKLHYHLGSSTQHTVHEAELVGILLGLHLIKTDRKGKTSYAIGVDNQAALSALKSVNTTTGQHIANEILETAAKIKKQRSSNSYSLKFRWTAGHVGIKGNEEVDGEAKKAAEGQSSDKKELPPLLRKPLKYNKAALRQRRREVLKARWAEEWEATERAGKFKAMDLIKPSNEFIKLISNDRLSRMDASRIFQLRTGHVPLNAYLERFKRADSARCPACGHPKESTQHYLFDCPAYKHERWALYKHCKAREPKMKDLLNCADMVIPLANYIQATGRFDQETSQEGIRRGGDSQSQSQSRGSQTQSQRHAGPIN